MKRSTKLTADMFEMRAAGHTDYADAVAQSISVAQQVVSGGFGRIPRCAGRMRRGRKEAVCSATRARLDQGGSGEVARDAAGGLRFVRERVRPEAGVVLWP